jgi:hypothetical protein
MVAVSLWDESILCHAELENQITVKALPGKKVHMSTISEKARSLSVKMVA